MQLGAVIVGLDQRFLEMIHVFGITDGGEDTERGIRIWGQFLQLLQPSFESAKQRSDP